MLLLSSCGALGEEVPSPVLVFTGGDTPFSYGFEGTQPGEQYLFGDLPLCLDSAGAQVEITSVALGKSSRGFGVTDFATRVRQDDPGWESIGNATGSLKAAGFADGSSPKVSTVCDSASPTGGVTELMIELTKEEATTAVGAPLLVTYRWDGGEASLSIPFTVALCGRPSGEPVRICNQ